MKLNEFLVKNESQIIEVKVTPEMLKQAEEKAAKMGILNSHSMMRGERNVEGILGELAALKFLPQAEATDNFDNDFRIGDITFDVKTKRLTNKPRLYFDCTVYGYNPHQNCHLYLFAGVKADLSVVWLSGFISKKDFYQNAEFCPKGTQRPLGNDKMLTYKEDNYVVQVKQLSAVEVLNRITLKKKTENSTTRKE